MKESPPAPHSAKQQGADHELTERDVCQLSTVHTHSCAISCFHSDVITCHVAGGIHGDGVCGVGCDLSERRARR